MWKDVFGGCSASSFFIYNCCFFRFFWSAYEPRIKTWGSAWTSLFPHYFDVSCPSWKFKLVIFDRGFITRKRELNHHFFKKHRKTLFLNPHILFLWTFMYPPWTFRVPSMNSPWTSAYLPWTFRVPSMNPLMNFGGWVPRRFTEGSWRVHGEPLSESERFDRELLKRVSKTKIEPLLWGPTSD